MQHDQDKECLDDSIIVDTSSARSAGSTAIAAYRKDDEFLPLTSETMIRVAMIHLMIRRLAPTIPYWLMCNYRAWCGIIPI